MTRQERTRASQGWQRMSIEATTSAFRPWHRSTRRHYVRACDVDQDRLPDEREQQLPAVMYEHSQGLGSHECAPISAVDRLRGPAAAATHCPSAQFIGLRGPVRAAIIRVDPRRRLQPDRPSDAIASATAKRTSCATAASSHIRGISSRVVRLDSPFPICLTYVHAAHRGGSLTTTMRYEVR